MGWIGCVHCKKYRRDFVARTFALVRNVLLRVSQGNKIVTNAPRRYEMHQNMSLGSNGVNWVRSSRKKSDSTSWHDLLHSFGLFCPEFRKGTKRFQMHRNSTKCTKIFSLVSNGVDQVRSMRKIPTRLRGTNFCSSSARFATNSVRQPNGPKCAQII